MKALALLLLVLAAAAPAAAQELLEWAPAEIRAIASHGPWPPPPPRDPSNRASGNPAAIVLGQHLFNERRLSTTARLSCADCHQAGRDWRDGRAKGHGMVEVDRRTPSLWNVGYFHWFGWDGAADSLWMQSIRPMLDRREMDGSRQLAANLLRGDAAYRCGHRRAFGELPEDDEKLLVDVGKALAAFQETLVSPRTPFDDFRDALVAGDRERAARYPLAAQRGLKMFVGHANCSACHFGPLFSNGEFGDVGIPFFVRPGEVDSGRYGGIERLRASPFNRLGPHSDDRSGASATRTRHVERQHRNFGEFKVPGLRQVGRTAPYMHDGSIATLEEVVKHYSEVSADRLHSDGTPLVRPLGMSAEERTDMVTFLRSLDVDAPVMPPPPPLCP